MRHNRDAGRKGGPNDDVAQNLRNEMQADARPSAEEARADQRKWLREEGCAVEGCGVDDPDQLKPVHEPMRGCSFLQERVGEPTVYCTDHIPEYESWRVTDIRNARKRNQTDGEDDVGLLVRFECDRSARVAPAERPTHEVTVQSGYDDEGNPVYETKAQPDHRAVPQYNSVPAECHCGAGIAELIPIDPDAQPDDPIPGADSNEDTGSA